MMAAEGSHHLPDLLAAAGGQSSGSQRTRRVRTIMAAAMGGHLTCLQLLMDRGAEVVYMAFIMDG